MHPHDFFVGTTTGFATSTGEAIKEACHKIPSKGIYCFILYVVGITRTDYTLILVE